MTETTFVDAGVDENEGVRLRSSTSEAEPVEEHWWDEVFERLPVSLEEFVTSPEYLNNPPLSEVQSEAVRHMERIYLPETYEWMAEHGAPGFIEPVRYINFAWLQWGKGSGKDHVCRIAVARWVYLLLCLNSPQVYFGMPRQDTIHVLNVASSAPQAYRAFFAPLRRLVKDAKCFRGQYETRQGDEPGRGSILFAKNIEAVSGHSDAETQEGLNLLGGIADEISAFRTIEETVRSASGREPAKTSESVLKMMRTSARTRFPRNFKIAALSYPRFKGDAIQQLTNRGLDDNERNGERSRVFVSGPRPTWDVNPRVSDKAEFADDYAEDPAMAEAMYECKPGFATNRFFRNDIALYASFHDRRPDPVLVSYRWGKQRELGVEEANSQDAFMAEQDGWQVEFTFSPECFPLRGAIYVAHADLATTGDRAGFALVHVERYVVPEHKSMAHEDALREPKPVVKVDALGAFEADIAANPSPREVQLRWFRTFVFECMRRGFYVARVTLDGWQSLDTIQILESRGVESGVLSVDRNTAAYTNLQDLMYDGRLHGYWNRLVLDELMGLMRIGKKADHPPNGSKDIADALAGACMGAVELGGAETEVRADQQGGVSPFASPSFGGEGAAGERGLWGSPNLGGQMGPLGS